MARVAADFRGLALLGLLDDGDFFLDLRSFQRLLLADFLLFDFPAPFEHKTLLLAQYPRPLVGNFLFLFGQRDRLVAVDLKDAKARIEAALAHRERGFLAHLMALVARPLLGGRNRRGARDLRLLPFAFLGGEIDRLVALGALAGEIAGDFGNLGFARLVDQRDLAVAALLLQCQFLLHLRDLAALCLGRESDIALGASCSSAFSFSSSRCSTARRWSSTNVCFSRSCLACSLAISLSWLARATAS